MKPAARKGDKHNCLWHWTNSVATGSRQMVTENERQARIGDFCWCTASVFTGAATVMVDGRPAARLEDKTTHFGTLVTGARSVYIGGPSTNAISHYLSEFGDWLKDNWKRVAEALGLAIIAILAVAGIFVGGIPGIVISAVALAVKLGLGLFVDEKYLEDFLNPLTYIPIGGKVWNAIKNKAFVRNIVKKINDRISRGVNSRKIRDAFRKGAERVANEIQNARDDLVRRINHPRVISFLRRIRVLRKERIEYEDLVAVKDAYDDAETAFGAGQNLGEAAVILSGAGGTGPPSPSQEN